MPRLSWPAAIALTLLVVVLLVVLGNGSGWL
jgi:hypothetical protein